MSEPLFRSLTEEECSKMYDFSKEDMEKLYNEGKGLDYPREIYMDPKILEAARDEFEWVFPEIRWQEELLIFLRLKKRLRPIKIKKRRFMDLVPRVKLKGVYPEAIYKIE